MSRHGRPNWVRFTGRIRRLSERAAVLGSLKEKDEDLSRGFWGVGKVVVENF